MPIRRCNRVRYWGSSPSAPVVPRARTLKLKPFHVCRNVGGELASPLWGGVGGGVLFSQRSEVPTPLASLATLPTRGRVTVRVALPNLTALSAPADRAGPGCARPSDRRPCRAR